MTRIIFTCSSLTSGGAERVLSVLSQALSDTYDEVEYVMWGRADVFYNIDNRVKLTSIEHECGSSNILKKIIWFRKYIDRKRPNLILSFSAPFNMLTLASLLFSKHKVIACERVDPRSFRWGKPLEIIRNILYNKAAGILTQTQMSKEYFRGKLYQKTDIIFNPITMDKDDIGSALTSLKNNTIVTAGRLVKQKRHDLLIRSFSRFEKEHAGYKLIIYGEGPERNNIETLVKTLHLEGVVELPGNTKDLWNKIKSAKMFIMTSSFEGMSNSMIEAMCLGIPTISTKVSGATDLINHNNNGILIDIDDEESAYKAMCKIADNQSFSDKLSINGSNIYNELRVENISKQWIKYINDRI